MGYLIFQPVAQIILYQINWKGCGRKQSRDFKALSQHSPRGSEGIIAKNPVVIVSASSEIWTRHAPNVVGNIGFYLVWFNVLWFLCGAWQGNLMLSNNLYIYIRMVWLLKLGESVQISVAMLIYSLLFYSCLLLPFYLVCLSFYSLFFLA